MYRVREVADTIDAITMQLRPQWGKPPLSRPALLFCLRADSGRQDSDNIVTTLLDCLQVGTAAKPGAGVLVNDNAKHLRTYGVCVADGEPGCDIYVSPHGWTPLMVRLLTGDNRWLG
jgi:hypothetical protein